MPNHGFCQMPEGGERCPWGVGGFPHDLRENEACGGAHHMKAFVNMFGSIPSFVSDEDEEQAQCDRT